MQKILLTCFLALPCLFLKAQSPPEKPVFVHGEIRQAIPQDSLRLIFWDHYLGQFVSFAGKSMTYVPILPGSILQGNSESGVIQLSTAPISQPAYLSISSILGDFYLDRFLVEPGDSLLFSLDLRLGKLIFLGPQADKFTLQHRLALIRAAEMSAETPSFHLRAGQDPQAQQQEFLLKSPPSFTFSPRNMVFVQPGEPRYRWMIRQLQSLPRQDPRLRELEKWTPDPSSGISGEFLQILQADILGEAASRSLSLIKNLPLDSPEQTNLLIREYLQRVGELSVPDSIAVKSAYFPQFLIDKESLLALQTKESLFSRLESNYGQLLFDELAARFLFANYQRLPDFRGAVASALERMQADYLKIRLQALAQAHQPGLPAEALNMTDLQGNPVSLQNFKGKTLLLAFWFPGCTPSKLMHERQLTKVMDRFRDHPDFRLISVNTDPDPELWKTYLKENPGYSFGNLHLFLGGRDVHPFLTHYDIQAYPALMLIDAEGNLIRSLKMPSQAEGLIDLIASQLHPTSNHSNPNIP
ncbi:TlpA disulfide reductase family protein [Algoriphagus sp. AK58]|uniref:TlpA family protein disulfide reductase n=1 Tax=Algoriphagus sp. AK58 TaxID=1406877 RepID=UPI00164F15BB|nr:TlpA disulfide reductase family protein [Algoriphagus sp. AK58]MBC6369057.1 hypothetical protein [Algoriphagus sp. AK58]